MSSLLRRIRKAAKANADEARLIPPKPVYDARRLTAEELDRINALYAKARSHGQGKELDWSKMSDDELMELRNHFLKAQVKSPQKCDRLK